MIDNNLLEGYLSRVDEKFSNFEKHKFLMRFICNCLVPIVNWLPPVAKNAFDKAKKHWLQNEELEEELELVKNECWEFLRKNGHGVEIEGRETILIRATLCTLYPTPADDDFSNDTVRWFIGLVSQLDDYPADLEKLMASSLSMQ